MTAGGLRAVFLAERPALQRLLRARLGDPSEAEDALQDLWIKLEATVSGPIAHPSAYLFRMANNMALDRRRSAAYRRTRDGDWLEGQPRADEYPNAEDALIASDRLKRVEAALAELPERTALAFRLFRFEGLRQRAIAERMQISQSAVEKLLHRAYRQLSDAAGALEGGENADPHRHNGKEAMNRDT